MIGKATQATDGGACPGQWPGGQAPVYVVGRVGSTAVQRECRGGTSGFYTRQESLQVDLRVLFNLNR